MNNEITMEKIDKLRTEGFACAQIVLAYGADKLGLDRETALKISAPFNRGMNCGATCGCVTGALMALGLKYGQCEPYDMMAKSLTAQKATEFQEQFTESHGTLICNELLGHDIFDPAGLAKIMEEGLLDSICPDLMLEACQMLDDMIDF